MNERPREPARGAWRVQRLCRDVDFRRALRAGVRVSARGLTLWLIDNDLGRMRLGLRVGRRCGGAVRRNRIKRVLREAFRRVQTVVRGGHDLVLAPGPDMGDSLTSAERVLNELLDRGTERLRQRGAADRGDRS